MKFVDKHGPTFGLVVVLVFILSSAIAFVEVSHIQERRAECKARGGYLVRVGRYGGRTVCVKQESIIELDLE